MSPFAGPLFAAALLLLAAGAVKVASPAGTRVALQKAGLPSQAMAVRLLGIVEVAIAVAALAIGGAVAAGLVALAYLGFAGFAALLSHRTRNTASCGCFGASDAPVGTVHVVVDLVAAALCAAAALDPTTGLAQATSETPWARVPFYGLTALLAWATYLSLTLLPELQAAMKTPGAAS